jgi:hypothetical protein
MTTITLSQVLSDTQHELTGLTMASEGNRERFNDGLTTGANADSVSIAVNNVWGARNKDGSHTGSYEKIGYHSGSVDFIAGVIESGCPVVVYRSIEGELQKLTLVAA